MPRIQGEQALSRAMILMAERQAEGERRVEVLSTWGSSEDPAEDSGEGYVRRQGNDAYTYAKGRQSLPMTPM
jgi:hypothetical protein